MKCLDYQRDETDIPVMRLPRVRFTMRRMIAVVAVVALNLAVFHRSLGAGIAATALTAPPLLWIGSRAAWRHASGDAMTPGEWAANLFVGSLLSVFAGVMILVFLETFFPVSCP